MYKYISILSISIFLMSLYIIYSNFTINKSKKNISLLVSISAIIISKIIFLINNNLMAIDFLYKFIIVLVIIQLNLLTKKRKYGLILGTYFLYIIISLAFKDKIINIKGSLDVILAIYTFYRVYVLNIKNICEKKLTLNSKLDKAGYKKKLSNEKLSYAKSITKWINNNLEKKEIILDTILNESKKCIMIIDKDGYIVSDENNFIKIWKEYEGFKGKVNINLFLKESIKNSDEFLHNLRKAREFEKEIKGELEGKDGRYFSIDYAPFIISNENVGAICSVIDITYDKKSKLKIKENDAKYKKIVDNIPYSVLITDENNILYNNEKYENINFNKYNIKNIILESCINGEICYIGENCEQTCLNIDRISFKDGESIKNVVAIRDITKYKKLSQELEYSKKKYESLVNIIPEGICILDLPKKKMTYSNKAIENMLSSVGMKEIKNSINDNIIIPSENDNDVVQFERKAIKNKFGEDVYLECGAMVIDVNEKLKMIGITRDVTDQVKAELMEKEIEEKKKENKIKNEFFINMSHELKTPLNVITSSNQLLEVMHKDYIEKNPESEISKAVGVVKKHSYMLIGLIDNIINLSKIESDFYESKRDYYNIVSIVEDVCSEFDKYVKVNNVNILFDTDEEEKVVKIDPYDIEKVILTLLSMIIRYLHNDSVVYVDLNVLDNKITINISSKGQFNYQIYINDQERKSLDMGIEVAKSIAKLYNGYIDIKIGLNNDIDIKVDFKLGEESETYKKRIKNKGDDFIYEEYLRICKN